MSNQNPLRLMELSLSFILLFCQEFEDEYANLLPETTTDRSFDEDHRVNYVLSLR